MPYQFSKQLTELLNQAVNLAEQHGVGSGKARLLLSEITSIPLPALTLSKDKILSPAELLRFENCFSRLLTQEPIQYILGKTNFYGLILFVNENVLIPRPETEGLVEWIVSQESGKQKVLDIGSGSGAIALTLKHLNPEYTVLGTDVSFRAVKIARYNAKQLGLRVRFLLVDLFPKSNAKFDLIVSNPPYVSAGDFAILDEEIRFYEPGLALLAKRNGLEFYERILGKAKRHLTPSGKIYFEIGETQAAAISELALNHGFKHIEVKQDLAGRDRYLCITA